MEGQEKPKYTPQEIEELEKERKEYTSVAREISQLINKNTGEKGTTTMDVIETEARQEYKDRIRKKEERGE